MKIIVDGDGCAGRQIIEKVAKENGVELIIYCDINHVIKSDYGEVLYVDSGFQTVDMKIANATGSNDIVITQDYGLAAMALGKKSYAMSPAGHIYSNSNIDKLLFERHMSAKARKSGAKTSKFKKRNTEDDERLRNNLLKLIKCNKNDN